MMVQGRLQWLGNLPLEIKITQMSAPARAQNEAKQAGRKEIKLNTTSRAYVDPDRINELKAISIDKFDLSKLVTWDIMTKDVDTVEITLPQAEILYVELLTGTKPFARELWILTKGNLQMETALRNKAKEMLEQNAIKAGILETATKDAEKALLKILWPIWLEEILIK